MIVLAVVNVVLVVILAGMVWWCCTRREELGYRLRRRCVARLCRGEQEVGWRIIVFLVCDLCFIELFAVYGG